MKIKRFIADSFQEAMDKAKTEMGKDAIILHSRKYKEGGIMGLFARQRFEITVALDETARTGLDMAKPLPHPAAVMAEDIRDEVVVSLTPEIKGQTIEKEPIGELSSLTLFPEVAKLEREIKNISMEAAAGSELAEDMLDEIRYVREAVESLKYQVESKGKLKPASRGGQLLYKSLLTNQVEDKLALKIVRSVEQQMEAEGSKDLMMAKELGMQAIVDLIKKPKPIEVKGKKVRVVALIGPTGVGKTTTIAKLAANFSLMERKRVAMVTVDTYRIAAVEQLKTYAEIIGVPLEVVFNPDDLQGAIRKFANKDVIFVDTAGRSPHNETQLAELKRFLDSAEPDEIILVLSATTRMEDLMEAYRKFNVTRIDKVIFTKLDETSRYGPILSVMHKTRSPISYITNGQNVPDDIEIPDEFRLARMVLGDEQVL